MKTIFIIPSWYPSAQDSISGIFFKQLAEAIAKYADEFRVVVCLWGQCDENIPLNRPYEIVRWIGDFIKRPRGEWRVSNGVEIVEDRAVSWSHRLPLGGSDRLFPVARRNLVRAIEKFGRVDLIHAFVSYPAGGLAYRLSSQFNIPYIVTETSGPFPFPSHRLQNGQPKSEIRDALTGAARRIVPSEYLAKRFEELGLPGADIIPWSVDSNRFVLGERSSSETINAVCCCRLVREKGVFDLLDAFVIASRAASNLRLKVIGSGPDENAIKQHSADNGLTGKIDWLGALSNDSTAEQFFNGDFFVLPSHLDTFGIVYIEAMASGMPVIATRCGGPDSFVTSEVGVLIDVGDVQGIAAAMVEMAHGYQRYERRRVREYCLEKFDRKKIAKVHHQVYTEVIDAKY